MNPVGILRRLRRRWREWQAAALHQELVDRYGEPPWPAGIVTAYRRAEQRDAARARAERPTLRPDPMSQIF